MRPASLFPTHASIPVQKQAPFYSLSVKHQVESSGHLAGTKQDPPYRLHVNPAESRQRHLLGRGQSMEERAISDGPHEIFEEHLKYVSQTGPI